MRKKLTATLIFLLCFAAWALPVSAETADYGFDLDISANAAILVNVDTGSVILEKNADTRVHPASTTKIMSVALAMTLCDDLENTLVTVPEGVWNEFEGMNISHAGLKVGEELTMYDLLHCLMLQSANEAAVALAAHYGRDNFIDMMNQKAAELGCTDTHFTNPHGAFVENHYTTARDMMLITQWAMTVPGFWEISQKARYYKEETNLNEAVTLVSTVWMQDTTSRYYTSYIKGIKTGTLDEAGRCLVSAAQQDGMTYLLVVLGCPYENTDLVWTDGSTQFTDTRRVYDWAFENLTLLNVVDTSTVVDSVKLRHVAGRDELLLYPDGELYAVVNIAQEDAEVRYEYVLPESIKAPVEVGDVIASAEVYYGDLHVGSVDLISREQIDKNVFAMVMDTIGEILTSTVAKVLYVVLLIVVLLYLYYMLIVVPRAQKNRKKKKSGGGKK